MRNIKTFIRSVASVGASVLLVSVMGSCHSGETTSFRDQLSQYLKKDMPVVSVSSNKYAAYFDFSGVYVAYDDSSTKKTFNNLKGIALGMIAISKANYGLQ